MPNVSLNDLHGSQIGFLEFHICKNRNELDRRHDFTSSSHSLEKCLLSVGMKEDYPVAFLKEISVEETLRKSGFGSSLLGKFEDISTERGCKMAVCRVGWYPGGTSREENIAFYKSCRWRLYEPSVFDLVMAFKELDSSGSPREFKKKAVANLVVDWADAPLKNEEKRTIAQLRDAFSRQKSTLRMFSSITTTYQ